MVEISLALIMLVIFYLLRLLLKQDFIFSIMVFALGMLFGFLVQLPLGRDLNRYTSNVSCYIGYVSLAVIEAWGIGLLSIYSLAKRLSRGLSPLIGVGIHALISLPLIVLIEFLGSNLLRFKLYNFYRFQPLLPPLNAMHAPSWLYLHYFASNLLFFYLLRLTGVEKKLCPSAAPPPP